MFIQFPLSIVLKTIQTIGMKIQIEVMDFIITTNKEILPVDGRGNYILHDNLLEYHRSNIVFPKPLKSEFLLTREHFSDKMLKLLGIKNEIEFNYPIFDKKFWVKGDNSLKLDSVKKCL